MDYNTDDELSRRLKNADPARYNNFQIGEEILTKAKDNSDLAGLSKTKKKPAIFAGAGLAMVAAIALTISTIPSSEPEFLISLNRDSAPLNTDSKAATSENSSDKSLMWYPYYNYTYLPGATLSREAGKGNAYKFELTGSAEESLFKLAKVFSLSDTKIVKDPYQYDENNYAIGDYENYQKEIINLTWSGLGSWYYSNPSAYQGAVIDDGCILPGYGIDGTVSSDSEILEDKMDREEIPAPTLCDPKPPADLPSREEAVATALEVFAEVGFQAEEKNLNINIDEWGIYISGNKTVEGTPVSLDYAISWAGPDIAYASGVLATPVLAGEVPTISEYDAVSRVSDWIWWGGYPMDGDYFRLGGKAIAEPSPRSVETLPETPEKESDTGGSSEGASPSDGSRKPADSTSIDPIPPDLGDAPEIEEIEITFTKATKRLLLIWDSLGTPWLLPGYVFEAETSEYLGGTPVVAVDSKYIDLSY